MNDTSIVLPTAIAILAIVLLFLLAHVDPVIALVIGTIYLGPAAGLRFEVEGTIETAIQALPT